MNVGPAELGQLGRRPAQRSPAIICVIPAGFRRSSAAVQRSTLDVDDVDELAQRWDMTSNTNGTSPGTAADSTPNNNLSRALHDAIVGQLQCIDDVVTAATIETLARNLVRVVVDRVGAADEILHELSEKLDRAREAHELTIAGLRTAQHDLGRLRIEHAQLGRDFDERCTQLAIANIELNRLRDDVHLATLTATAPKIGD